MDSTQSPIDLSNNEYIIVEVERSIFGVIGIYASTIFVAACCLFTAYIMQTGVLFNNNSMGDQAYTLIGLGVALIGILSLLMGYVMATIYWENRMFITNESVHQVVRRGFFDKSSQHIALKRVESVKANQRTMMQRMLNYGTLVFATEGTDVDYTLTYVKNPNRYPRIFTDAQQGDVGNTYKGW